MRGSKGRPRGRRSTCIPGHHFDTNWRREGWKTKKEDSTMACPGIRNTELCRRLLCSPSAVAPPRFSPAEDDSITFAVDISHKRRRVVTSGINGLIEAPSKRRWRRPDSRTAQPTRTGVAHRQTRASARPAVVSRGEAEFWHGESSAAIPTGMRAVSRRGCDGRTARLRPRIGCPTCQRRFMSCGWPGSWCGLVETGLATLLLVAAVPSSCGGGS
jgi:hypothetical protein